MRGIWSLAAKICLQPRPDYGLSNKVCYLKHNLAGTAKSCFKVLMARLCFKPRPSRHVAVLASSSGGIDVHPPARF